MTFFTPSLLRGRFLLAGRRRRVLQPPHLRDGPPAYRPTRNRHRGLARGFATTRPCIGRRETPCLSPFLFPPRRWGQVPRTRRPDRDSALRGPDPVSFGEKLEDTGVYLVGSLAVDEVAGAFVDLLF